VEQYSIDGRGRAEIYVTLALIAVALTYLVHQELSILPVHLPWWVDVPSFAVFFGLTNVLFDRWLWRVRFLGLRLSPIPNFSGNWDGSIHASADRKRTVEIPVKVHIEQTWSAIGVKGTTANGVTRSKIAGVRIEDNELRYEYEMHAHVMRVEGRHHVGFAVLQLLDQDHLEGYYYTLEGSTTKGTMVLRRAAGHASRDR
jgi:hypothetical protein